MAEAPVQLRTFIEECDSVKGGKWHPYLWDSVKSRTCYSFNILRMYDAGSQAHVAWKALKAFIFNPHDNLL